MHTFREVVLLREADQDEREARERRKKAYLKKLKGLLKSAAALDKQALKGSRDLTLRMQDAVLARVAAAAGDADKGIFPSWGPYWVPQIEKAVAAVTRELAAKFQDDLTGWTHKSFDIGAAMADGGLETVSPGILGVVPRIDPNLILLAGNFSADLITKMEKRQITAVSKLVATSVALGEPPSKLMAKLATTIDAGPWKEVNYRAELIARTEIARVQALAVDHRMHQAQQATGIQLFQQFLVAEIGEWPCENCSKHEDHIFTLDGVCVKPPGGPPAPELPVHPNCRCALIPYVPEAEGDTDLVPMRIELPEDESQDGPPELPPPPPPPSFAERFKALGKPTSIPEVRTRGQMLHQEIQDRWEAEGFGATALDTLRKKAADADAAVQAASKKWREAMEATSAAETVWKASEGQALWKARMDAWAMPAGPDRARAVDEAEKSFEKAREKAIAAELVAEEKAKNELYSARQQRTEAEDAVTKGAWPSRTKVVHEVLKEVRDFGPGAEGPTFTGNRQVGAVARAALSYFPTDWLKDMRGSVQLKKVSRGYYNDRGILAVSGSGPVDQRRVMLHELGHRAEYRVSGLLRWSVDYLNERTAGDRAQQLRHLKPGMGYRPTEIVKPDKFTDPYWGKQYFAGSRQDATELVSMGMEVLFAQDREYAQKVWTEDVEMLEFLLGAVATL